MGDSEFAVGSTPSTRVSAAPPATAPEAATVVREGNPTSLPTSEARAAVVAPLTTPEAQRSLPGQRPPIEQVSGESKGLIDKMKENYRRGSYVSGTIDPIGDAIIGKQTGGPISAIRVLLASPLALVSALVGPIVDGGIKELRGNDGNSPEKSGYIHDQEELNAATTAQATLQTQVDGLKKNLADKVKEADKAASSAQSTAAEIAPGDEKSIKAIDAQAKTALEARELAKALKKKQEELADAKKRTEKAQSRFDKASANIRQEAVHTAARAADASREASETLRHIDQES